MDVYDEMPELKICTAYRLDGRVTDGFSASAEALDRAEPVLDRVSGWSKPVKGCRRFSELPREARDYIRRVEEYCGVPVDVVSTGPNRSETIVRRDPWTPS
jgi:adenylosuccinate synthase